ncbi:hypothetical protein [Serratia quinivorans]|uniref:hypothetical protein n=1 Tax=Serratia quinivorans TaxID=137545 RepID=UPI003F97B275
MADPTLAIDNLLNDLSVYNADELRIIIAFVNELDNTALNQYENDSERAIMSSFERLRQSSDAQSNGGDNTNEMEMGLLNNGNNTTLQNRPGFFQKYKTSLRGYGGNVYDDRQKSNYDYAAKAVGAIGALSGAGATYAAIAAAQAADTLMTNIYVRYAMTTIGATGIVSAGLLMLRNTLSERQQTDNKDLLEATKRTAKARIKLIEFVNETRIKIIKDEDKCRSNAELYMGRRFTDQGRSNADPNLGRIETLLFTTLNERSAPLQAKILLTSEQQYVSIISDTGPTDVSKANMKLMYEIASTF